MSATARLQRMNHGSQFCAFTLRGGMTSRSSICRVPGYAYHWAASWMSRRRC